MFGNDLDERLANLISDHIVPRLVPELEIIPWRRSHVVAVQMHASQFDRTTCTEKDRDQGVYVRGGSTNRRADRELIEELRRFARGEAHDEQPMPELDSEALDVRAASEWFTPVRHLRRTDLQTLRLVASHQGRHVPTVGGILLFGANREQHFPDARIQAGRFRGVDKSQGRLVVTAGFHELSRAASPGLQLRRAFLPAASHLASARLRLRLARQLRLLATK